MSDVLARVEGEVGHITLNRPAALNALTLDMVREIDRALAAWEKNDSVALVLMDGAGERGFCAGGDIRALYDAAKAKSLDLPETFFGEEYHLNRRIARYGKPIVALMDGVVMGGGIGLGGHSSHRVVTERSVLAMPETRIGFIPDVGGTYLLGTAPGELGTHAALSGGRMDGADAIVIGMADLYVPSAKLDDLRRALIEEGSIEALQRFSEPVPPSKLAAARGWIDRCYARDQAEAILSALDAAPEPEAQKAAAEIRGASPSSVKITLKALRRARAYGALEPCLEQEFNLALSILRDPDFVEGVRAAVVDKDRNPAWNPGRLEAVTEQQVERHFQERKPLWQE